jgi:hypothetical protein
MFSVLLELCYSYGHSDSVASLMDYRHIESVARVMVYRHIECC